MLPRSFRFSASMPSPATAAGAFGALWVAELPGLDGAGWLVVGFPGELPFPLPFFRAKANCGRISKLNELLPTWA